MEVKKDILTALKESLVKQRFTDTVEVDGHKYKFQSLNEGENLWRDRFLSLDSNAAFLTSERVTTLAISIIEIDDTPIEEVFNIEKAMPPYERKCAAAEAMLDLLRNSTRDKILALRTAYEKTIGEKQDELKKNSLSTTPNSNDETKSSSADNTSLPEKDMSAPTRRSKK